MFLRKIRISITKLMLPFLHKILKLLKTNTRTVNFLNDKKIHEKYLKHENIDNLKGLEVELIYEWEVGSMLIFDRTHLHCSSSVIEGKKIGIATFTKK